MLHHVADLRVATAHLARLLAGTGVLIVDEFDWAAADAATAAWFYGTRDLLTATGAATVEDDDPPNCRDPLARWQHEHTTDPPLHGGAEIRQALQNLFALQRTERTDGLWVYLCQDLDDTDHAGDVAARLRDLERSLLATQTITPVGLHITARLRRPIS